MFADDTSVFLEGVEYHNIITELNMELEKADIWLKANKLTINLRKTHYMVFHRSRRKFGKVNLTLNGTKIALVSHTKFLEIIIDN